jgi:undecaprenyl phosphate N,N'-diacetylbacillosamine 1-phosphate transferase
MYRTILKPSIDFAIIGISIPLFVPVFFFIWAWLKLTNEEGAFYTQKRPGKSGKIFVILKFRTLNKIGRPISISHSFLRKSGLDEIPQIINILKGEMSLVGPRPLLVEYLPMYNERQRKRHDVMPGITGLAQVRAMDLRSWDEIFDLDLEYLKSQSFFLDLKILFMTLVLKSSFLGQSKRIRQPELIWQAQA